MSNAHRKIASGSFLRVVNMMATSVIALLIMPFVIHKLGDRLYGIWTLVATFVGYYGLLEVGLSPAVERFLAKSLGEGNEPEANRVFNTALRIYGVLGLVVLGVTGAIAAAARWLPIPQSDSTLFGRIILILGVSIAIQFPSKVFIGILQAHLRFDLDAELSILSTVLRTSLVILALLAGLRVVGLALATFLASLPSVGLSIYFAIREVPSLRIDSKYWARATARQLFSFSAFSLIINLANILRFQVDNFVVASFVSLVAVTHYRIGGALGQYFFAFMRALLGFFNPVFSRHEGAKNYEAIKKTLIFGCRLATCVSGFIAFELIALGKPFITRWMGAGYADAYPVLVILVISHFLNLYQMPAAGMLFGLSKHKFLAILTSIEGVVNLVLSIVLARKYGMVGVAVGTLVPMAVSKIFILPIYVCRVADVDYFQFVRRMGRTLGAVAVALLIPLLLVLKLAVPNYKVLFLIGILSMMVYGFALWLLEFSAYETRLLAGAVWPRMRAKIAVE